MGWPLPPSSDPPHQVLRGLPALSFCVVAIADTQKPAQFTISGNVLEAGCQTGTFFILSSINVSDGTSNNNNNNNSNYNLLDTYYV